MTTVLRARISASDFGARVSVQLFAFTCGHLTIPHGFLIEGAKGKLRVPVPAYLITHPRGRVLFDSGLHLAVQSDAAAHMGERGMRGTTFHFSAGEEVSARLLAAGCESSAITHVVNSHLHYDHCGGNAQLEHAQILVQRREWEHARALPGDDPGYRRRDFDTGQRVTLLDGEHDVFGDASVVCFPTHGHTPGHQSLRVRTARGEFVLCGDACYLRASLEQLALPGVVFDREAALAALKRFAAMEAAGARVMVGHDPAFWVNVPQAPARLA
jgi:glyoxylase-like metal-dependent hydrolase (beta-lactamase superfamily II)